MRTVGTFEAKTHLSAPEQVERGEKSPSPGMARRYLLVPVGVSRDCLNDTVRG
jgi:hypothetical protein